MKGRRFVLASELKEGCRLNTSTVKQLTSIDPVHAEKKYYAPFDFDPTHTLVLYTNHLPKVGAMDNGIWRRLIVVPFKARIEGNGEIKNYSDYLLEHAGGAVLKWIMEGAQKVIKNNFKLTTPACVEAAIEAYKEDNDWLAHFLDDRCVIDSKASVRANELYQDYRGFCNATGEYARSNADFSNALVEANFIRRRTATGVMFYGVKLKPDKAFYSRESADDDFSPV